MLEKIRQMPLSVRLSILFLLSITVVLFFIDPYVTTGIIAVGLTLISIGRLFGYWVHGD
jgi:hypothetical protein